MKYNITEDDKNRILYTSGYKYKLLVVDNKKNIIDELEGFSSVGSYSINSESDIRRTTSFTLLLDNVYRNSSVEKKLFSWIGYSFKKQIGVYSLRDDDYKWYDCGYYLITEANTIYNATDNSLSVNLSDWYSRLNGTRNGQIGGAPIISIPNLDKNGKTVTIKKVTEDILKELTDIKDYIIDDIGEFYCMPQNNPTGYQERRDLNPNWNQLPYDLEYNIGCHVSDILEEIKNLYPNCQMYFDVYGNFCFNMIPSCEYDPVILDDKDIQQILLADNTESVDYDIKGIKNVTEVFGQSYEVDRYADKCTTVDNIYNLNLKLYEDYSDGDMIAFIPDITIDTMETIDNKEEIQPESKTYTYTVEINDYVDNTLKYHYIDTFTYTTDKLIGGYIYSVGNYQFIDFYQKGKTDKLSFFWSSHEDIVGKVSNTNVDENWNQFYYSYQGEEADEINVSTTIPLFNSKTELINYLNGSDDSSIYIKINNLDAVPLCYEYTMNYVDSNIFEEGKTYVIKLKKDMDGNFIAYYLGQYQPHALCVLTNSLHDSKYNRKYFATKYNCDVKNIVFRIEPESPFTVQKIGEVLDVKTGEEFDNILSDSVAIDNAVYYNKQSSSVHDTVTISTKMIPFLDTNVKVKYRKQQEEQAVEYIVKSIDNDMNSYTSRITMYRFYPLYLE